VPENVRDFMEGFRYDAHPMGMLLASVGALSTFYPESRNISDADNRHMQIVRLIAKMPTLGAWSFRHAQGKPFIYPDNELSYTANFLSMLFKMSEQKFDADERLVKALDVLFILHADHEQNRSTNAVRSVGSSQVDPYSGVAGPVAGAGAGQGAEDRPAEADLHRRPDPRLHARQRAVGVTAGLGSPPAGVIWDLGNVLIDWSPHAAVAAGVGDDEARRFLS